MAMQEPPRGESTITVYMHGVNYQVLAVMQMKNEQKKEKIFILMKYIWFYIVYILTVK